MVGKHPLSMLIMWSLNVWMAFLARLRRWSSGGDEFVCHLGEFDFGFVCKRCLVVKYLVSWDNAALGHLRKCMTAGENEFALAVILESLASGEVGVHVVEDHNESGCQGWRQRGNSLFGLCTLCLSN
jgi:hypothetical protein